MISSFVVGWRLVVGGGAVACDGAVACGGAVVVSPSAALVGSSGAAHSPEIAVASGGGGRDDSVAMPEDAGVVTGLLGNVVSGGAVRRWGGGVLGRETGSKEVGIEL